MFFFGFGFAGKKASHREEKKKKAWKRGGKVPWLGWPSILSILSIHSSNYGYSAMYVHIHLMQKNFGVSLIFQGTLSSVVLLWFFYLIACLAYFIFTFTYFCWDLGSREWGFIAGN
jgi:hypothetical protein